MVTAEKGYQVEPVLVVTSYHMYAVASLFDVIETNPCWVGSADLVVKWAYFNKE